MIQEVFYNPHELQDLQGEMMTMLLDYVKTRPVGLSSPEVRDTVCHN